MTVHSFSDRSKLWQCWNNRLNSLCLKLPQLQHFRDHVSKFRGSTSRPHLNCRGHFSSFSLPISFPFTPFWMLRTLPCTAASSPQTTWFWDCFPCSGEPQPPQPAPAGICSPSCLLSVSHTDLCAQPLKSSVRCLAVFAGSFLEPCPLCYSGHSSFSSFLHMAPQHCGIHEAPVSIHSPNCLSPHFSAPTFLLLSPAATPEAEALCCLLFGPSFSSKDVLRMIYWALSS